MLFHPELDRALRLRWFVSLQLSKRYYVSQEEFEGVLKKLFPDDEICGDPDICINVTRFHDLVEELYFYLEYYAKFRGHLIIRKRRLDGKWRLQLLQYYTYTRKPTEYRFDLDGNQVINKSGEMLEVPEWVRGSFHVFLDSM